MRATCWHGTRSVRVERVPEPKILNSRDAIVRITRTAICGSDLHLYNGFVPTMRSGDVLGHEFMAPGSTMPGDVSGVQQQAG
jgi:threonine dehydrogenase-like Zn-dependent dehydrogenase